MHRYHSQNSEPNTLAESHSNDQQVGSVHDSDVEMIPDAQRETEQNKYSLSDIKTEGVALVASLRFNSSLPSKVIPEIVSSFNHISKCTVHYLKEQLLQPSKDKPSICVAICNDIAWSSL